MHSNIKYKDSVFSLLFSKPELLRELYCALEGVELPKDTPVVINTLQDVLFMNRINDISFEIGGKIIVLVEHQSTINQNLPLRMLLYIARLYEKIIDGKNMYKNKRIPIPFPVFIILYNGNAEIPDRMVLKLSDLFEHPGILTAEQEAALELSVTVININHGRNKEIAEKCETLAAYSAFIGKVKEFEKETKDKAEALKLAIKYCKEYDILKEFLELHSTEVFNMLLSEWSLDDAIAVSREEGREEGREDGLEISARNALAKGYPLEVIHDITGLNIETIERLQVDAR
ncbi:MAG: Rpn family recombination-promoting nuclease/putative transposase [Treponema sp.]|nr:Rpn family recombination-promoting nuclease/putative transposase [Treponema sp.]